MSRHLTNEEKAQRLEYLEGRIADGPHPDGKGDQGYIDLSIVPYLRRINRLDGVCTLQSCAGHILTSSTDGEEYLQSGNLWLRLSRDVATRFCHRVGMLVRLPLIERVSILYHWHSDCQEVREVVSIDFQGDENDVLSDSMGRVIGFLEHVEK